MLRRSLLLLGAALFCAPAPDFEFTSVKGEKETLSKYRGKAIALYFFSPSCSHCQNVCQILGKVQNDHRDDLQVLGATFTEDAEKKMPDFMQAVNPPYPVGASKRDAILKWLNNPPDDGKQMPRLVLLDAKGSVRGSYSWRDPMFGNAATEETQIRAAIEKVIRAGKPK